LTLRHLGTPWDRKRDHPLRGKKRDAFYHKKVRDSLPPLPKKGLSGSGKKGVIHSIGGKNIHIKVILRRGIVGGGKRIFALKFSN